MHRLIIFCLFSSAQGFFHLLSPFIEVSDKLEVLSRNDRGIPARTRSRQPLPFKNGDFVVNQSISSKERREHTGYAEVWAVPTKMPKMNQRQDSQGILTAVISSLLGPGRRFNGVGGRFLYYFLINNLLFSALVGPPTNVRVEPTSNNSAVVQWDFDAGQVDGFVIRYTQEPDLKAEDRSKWVSRTVQSSSARHLIIENLAHGKMYAFCVMAIKNNVRYFL